MFNPDPRKVAASVIEAVTVPVHQTEAGTIAHDCEVHAYYCLPGSMAPPSHTPRSEWLCSRFADQGIPLVLANSCAVICVHQRDESARKRDFDGICFECQGGLLRTAAEVAGLALERCPAATISPVPDFT